jgi:hypothetical protein
MVFAERDVSVHLAGRGGGGTVRIDDCERHFLDIIQADPDWSGGDNGIQRIGFSDRT